MVAVYGALVQVMQTSEDQFQELLAHLLVRGNAALAKTASVPPMSFSLGTDGSVQFSVGTADTPNELQRVLGAMRESLVNRVKTEPIVATCIAYSESESGDVVAMLENHENFCATVRMQASPGSKLNLDRMEIGDGFVHVFPIDNDS